MALVTVAARAEAQTETTVGGSIEALAADDGDFDLHAETIGVFTAQPPAPPPLAPDSQRPFRRGAAFGQAAIFTIFQHGVRLREGRTRRELGGSFFGDWFTSISNAGRHWNDGGKIFTNYVAHPMGGAVYTHIYKHNDQQDWRVGESGYSAMALRAMLFSALTSLQFELGPLSEASIGNVGLRDPRKMALVDFVITPTLGTAWMIGEDLLDERLLTRIDGANIVLRSAARLFLNPARSGANFSRGRWPWYRSRD